MEKYSPRPYGTKSERSCSPLTVVIAMTIGTIALFALVNFILRLILTYP